MCHCNLKNHSIGKSCFNDQNVMRPTSAVWCGVLDSKGSVQLIRFLNAAYDKPSIKYNTPHAHIQPDWVVVCVVCRVCAFVWLSSGEDMNTQRSKYIWYECRLKEETKSKTNTLTHVAAHREMKFLRKLCRKTIKQNKYDYE